MSGKQRVCIVLISEGSPAATRYRQVLGVVSTQEAAWRLAHEWPLAEGQSYEFLYWEIDGDDLAELGGGRMSETAAVYDTGHPNRDDAIARFQGIGLPYWLAAVIVDREAQIDAEAVTLRAWERRRETASTLLCAEVAACPATPVVGTDAVDVRVPAAVWRAITGEGK
ncbi:MAG: hypothetical protein WC455_23345 [Dehalococcoidia bacterium]|jgi:hypothetical protein